MLKAIFFDLDNTLLGNNMDDFMGPYFDLVSASVADLLPPDRFLAALLAGTRSVIANAEPALTNEELFWQTFEAHTGRSRTEFEPRLRQFYKEQFPALRSFTQHRPVAADLVRFCYDAGLQVVVATNPLFPRQAIEQRLEWAGLPPAENDFALVTTFENMHAAKPSADYYKEILTTLNLEPREAIMVGDEWDNDIAPANRLKMFTFWIAPDDISAPVPLQATSRGTLEKFLACCQSGWLQSLV